MRTLALCALALAGAQEPPRKPNIVFVLADDLGWTDLGCQGSRYYETPHIDRLAAQGTRYLYGYTCGANCQPTRAALMTGLYGPRTGVYTVGGIDRFDWSRRPLRPVDNVEKLAPAFNTVAESLKAQGYATAHFGKWHLGETAEHHPSNQGFDEALVTMGKHVDFKTTPKADVPPGAYLADFLTDKALDFIRRRKDQPFFLYLPHFGVHSPFQAKKELIERFKGKEGVDGHRDPVYAAMIASVDESVGRLTALLDELKLAGNTLFIFSSDNGGVGGYAREGLKGGGVTDNAPLRGGKGMFYEGGVRVPFIVRWPGKVAAGATSETPVISVDLHPTLRAVAGAAPDPNLDGVDILGAPRERALYWHFPGYLGQGKDQWRTTPVGAIRLGDWKLLQFFEDEHVELYNLREDPGERRDLTIEKGEKALELLGQLASWREGVKAPMPAKK